MAGVELSQDSVSALMNSGIDRLSQMKILGLFNKLPESERNAIKQKINEAPAAAVGNVKKALGSNPAEYLGRLEKSDNPAAEIKKMIGVEDNVARARPASNAVPQAENNIPRAQTVSFTPGMASVATLKMDSGRESTLQVEPVATRREVIDRMSRQQKEPQQPPPPSDAKLQLSQVSEPALDKKLVENMGAAAANKIIEPYKVLEVPAAKNNTAYAFMKDLESRAASNPDAEYLSRKIMEQCRNNPDKAASLDRQLSIAPNARAEILEALDKKSGKLGMASIDNALTESRDADYGVTNIGKLRDSLVARSDNKQPASVQQQQKSAPAVSVPAPATAIAGWDQRLEARVGNDAADVVNAYAAKGGASANFSNFLQELETKGGAGKNQSAALVADRIYAQMDMQTADNFSRAFRNDDRFKAEILERVEKNPNMTPAEADSFGTQIYNKTLEAKNRPDPTVKAPAALGAATPVAAVAGLDPAIKAAADRLKEKLGVSAGSEASKDIDGSMLRVQPFMLEIIKNSPNPATAKAGIFEQNPLVEDMLSRYKKDPQVFKKFNAAFDENPDGIKAAMNDAIKLYGTAAAPTSTPTPTPSSPAVPAASGKIDFVAELTKLSEKEPELAGKVMNFVTDVGMMPDGQFRPGFEEFGQRVFKDPELKSSLIAALKGDGDNKMVDKLKEKLKEHPDLFEQLNTVMERNPKSAKKMFGQLASGNFDGGMETFSSTVRMNMVTDMICDFVGMFSPQLGNWMREKIDGLRNSKYGATLDQFAGKMLNKVAGEPEPENKPKTPKPGEPVKTQKSDLELQAAELKAKADIAEATLRIDQAEKTRQAIAAEQSKVSKDANNETSVTQNPVNIDSPEGRAQPVGLVDAQKYFGDVQLGANYNPAENAFGYKHAVGEGTVLARDIFNPVAQSGDKLETSVDMSRDMSSSLKDDKIFRKIGYGLA